MLLPPSRLRATSVFRPCARNLPRKPRYTSSQHPSYKEGETARGRETWRIASENLIRRVVDTGGWLSDISYIMNHLYASAFHLWINCRQESSRYASCFV